MRTDRERENHPGAGDVERPTRTGETARSMPFGVAAFIEAAALAATLSAAWDAAALLVGDDVRGRRAAALGVIAALLVAPALARRLPFARLALAAAAWAVILLLLMAPGVAHGLVPPGTGGLAVASALVFLFPIARVAVAAEALAARLSLSLAGAAVGLVAMRLAIEPFAGAVIGAPVLVALLALPRRREGATPAPLRPALTLAAGTVFGVVLDVSSLFLHQYSSGTRFSGLAVATAALLGLALGSGLPSLVEAPRGRAAVAWGGLVVAPVALVLSLLALSRARFPEAIQEAFVTGGALVECVVVFSALALPSLLVGWAAGESARSGRGLALGLVGLVAGLHIGVLAAPASLEEAMVRRRGRDMVTEHAISDSGVFERIRSFSRPGSAVAHWNRDPVGRSPEWDALARAEIVTVAALVRPGGPLVIIGSPGGAHVEAASEAGFASSARIDRLPPIAPGSPEPAESDPFRFAARLGRDERAAAVVVPSKPFLTSSDARLLTRDGFRVIGTLAGPDGAVIVWLDPGALPPDSIRPVLRAFFNEFPDGSLAVAQDGLYGPLFGLASGSLPLAAASARSLIDAIGSSPEERLSRPRLGASLPLRAPRSEHASPESLREWGLVLAQLAPDWGALVEALAVVTAEAAAGRPVNPFEESVEALAVSREGLEALTLALETYPRSTSVRDVVVAAGRVLLAQRESDAILGFGPRWIAARPDDAELHLLLGRQHSFLLDPAHALPLLERAAALSPESEEIRQALEAARALAEPR